MNHRTNGELSSLQDSKQAKKKKTYICTRCGAEFTPRHAGGRKYCYDLTCETDRQREAINQQSQRRRARRKAAKDALQD
jgi:hypothetical protein